jgi:hypothetical protein
MTAKGRTELESLIAFARGGRHDCRHAHRPARALDCGPRGHCAHPRGEGRCAPGDRATDRRDRQLEGIGKAKGAGVYTGRKPIDRCGPGRKLKAKGKGATEIAKALLVGHASVYRLLSKVRGGLHSRLGCGASMAREGDWPSSPRAESAVTHRCRPAIRRAYWNGLTPPCVI